MPKYLIPDTIEGYDEFCVLLTLPDNLEYRAAVRGQLTALGKWFVWEQTTDDKGRQAAEYIRQFIHRAQWDVPCEQENDCDEDDTWADELAALADGIIGNTFSGGAQRAIGYAIDEAGSIIVDTVLPLIGITLVGIGAAYVVTLVLGGLTIGTVAVAAAETVEVLIATGASASNIVEFAAIAALAA